VHGARQHFLAGAGFAQQHHRGRGRRHLLDGAADLQHAGVARDHAGQRRIGLRLLHAAVFLLQVVQEEGALDHQVQHFGSTGFWWKS
jgi:hypothetical protein